MSLVCAISTVYFLGHFFGTVFARKTDDVGGSQTWLLLTWIPELVVGVQNFVLMLVLNIRALRPSCVKRYGLLCAYMIVSSYVGTVVPAFVWELRYAEKGASSRYNETRLTIDYASFPPIRVCSVQPDSDKTCVEAVLSGTNYIIYIFWNLLPRICRVSARTCQVIACATFVLLLMLSLAAGIDAWTISFCTLFQLSAGFAASVFCLSGDQRSRDKYTMDKATQFAAEQNRALLYTLIPQNVVQRLATHTGAQMLGCDIALCTVMFCSLETHIPMALLDSLYIAFDTAVQRHGMFKYQHVGDWFIVACPRVAKPFDKEEQVRAHPDRNNPQLTRS
jgi:hypothetical protein